jgi:hypothetical protein
MSTCYPIRAILRTCYVRLLPDSRHFTYTLRHAATQFTLFTYILHQFATEFQNILGPFYDGLGQGLGSGPG